MADEEQGQQEETPELTEEELAAAGMPADPENVDDLSDGDKEMLEAEKERARVRAEEDKATYGTVRTHSVGGEGDTFETRETREAKGVGEPNTDVERLHQRTSKMDLS